MIKIIMLFVLSLKCMLYLQPTPGEQLAYKIGQKLKDTLSLSETQKQQIIVVNLNLHQLKQQARQQYTNMDTLTFHIQQVENTRDTLYHAILPATKFQLYKQKKGTLINNN